MKNMREMSDSNGACITEGYYTVFGMTYFHVKEKDGDFYQTEDGIGYVPLRRAFARRMIRLEDPDRLANLVNSVEKEKIKMMGIHGGGMRR